MTTTIKAMRDRAEQWVHRIGSPIVTRDSALGEEHMALDVLDLIAEVERLRAAPAVANQDRDEAWNDRDAQIEAKKRLVVAVRIETEQSTAERIAEWLEFPCDCGFADCETKYRELAAAVRSGVWRKP